MVSLTPASLTYSGGVLRTTRVVPARFRYTGGTVMSQRETATGSAVAVPNLDRLTMADMIPGEDQMSFMRRAAIWQSSMGAIEAALGAVNARVDELAAILARLTAAEQLAQTANDNAAQAKATVEVVQTAVADTFETIDPTYRDVFEEGVDRR